jgi:hypothetical protein
MAASYLTLGTDGQRAEDEKKAQDIGYHDFGKT